MRQLTSPACTPTLRWVFQKGPERLTCEVDATPAGWDVCVIPHEDPAAGAIEWFDASMSAFRRHAEIASRLRDRGWSVVHHAAVGSVGTTTLAA